MSAAAARAARLAASCLALAASGSLPAVADPGAWRVQQRWAVGGEGGWDYLAADTLARRLYVSRSDRVVVLDLDSGKPVGEIGPTAGVHGIALAPDLQRGFTSNGRSNGVTAFDARTLEVLREIPLAAQVPDAILYDRPSGRVFTFNARSADATAIDARSLAPVGRVKLGGKPEFAVSDGGLVYVNIQDRGELAVFDAKTLAVGSTWILPGCDEPTGLALDAARRRLFSVCQNHRMVVTDAGDGHRVASVPIGGGPDGAVFDPGSGNVFSSNGDGTLTIVHEDDDSHFRVVDNVPTQRSARTLAFDPATQRVFLAAATLGAPPAATAQTPHPRPTVEPGSFEILVVARGD